MSEEKRAGDRVAGAAAAATATMTTAARDAPMVLQALLDAASDGVIVVSAYGERRYSNPALDDLVGGDACGPRGSTDPPDWLPREQWSVWERLAAVAAGRYHPVATVRCHVMSGDGRRIPVQVTAERMGGPGIGTAVCLIHAVGEDVAVLRHLDETVRHLAGELARLGVRPEVVEPPSLQDNELWRLSERERAVLGHLLDGQRVSSIARTLHLSPHTVRNHLKAIFRKVGVHSQVELLERLKPTS